MHAHCRHAGHFEQRDEQGDDRNIFDEVGVDADRGAQWVFSASPNSTRFDRRIPATRGASAA
jgi:hypothetical protein